MQFRLTILVVFFVAVGNCLFAKNLSQGYGLIATQEENTFLAKWGENSWRIKTDSNQQIMSAESTVGKSTTPMPVYARDVFQWLIIADKGLTIDQSNLFAVSHKVLNELGLENKLDEEEKLNLLIDICLGNKNIQCLVGIADKIDSVSIESIKKDLQFKMLISLASISKDWVIIRSSLIQALSIKPDNLVAKVSAEVLSLKIARAVVHSYMQELQKASYTKAMGLGDINDYPQSTAAKLKDAFYTTIFNTGQALSIYAGYDEDLRMVYEEQINYLLEINAGILALERLIILEGKPLKELQSSTSKMNKSLRLASYKFLRTSIGRDIAKNHIFRGPSLSKRQGQFPSMAELGFRPEIDFVNPDWRFALAEQSNFLNLFMFTRMPVWVGAFGKSAWGIATINALRLNAIVARAGRLPYPINNLLIWFMAEVADGCVPRWIYAGYTLYNRATGPGIQTDPKDALKRIIK